MPNPKPTKPNTLKPFLLLALFIAIHSPCHAWSGKVVGIADGDTITVLNNRTLERIRLYGIDCPEKRQAFGRKAQRFTSRMVFGETYESSIRREFRTHKHFFNSENIAGKISYEQAAAWNKRYPDTD